MTGKCFNVGKEVMLISTESPALPGANSEPVRFLDICRETVFIKCLHCNTDSSTIEILRVQRRKRSISTSDAAHQLLQLS